ncbi:hypothetical protein V8H04_11980 [Staphylococcus aureus]|uniref:Phage protein n=1 Tax=Staphylococcus aureus TaxID=1280 RepID=A0A811I880_STAAU|nr:phage protein [Staphylococcus aureus]HCX0790264.1 hypothetical protein [Staphylococcus aureus]HCX0798802.1 hypothetical protein [Staphylococcus aureus]HCX0799650.1 hypothetical protein [Staphylococcus aureus]
MNYYNQFFKDEFLSTISEENRANFRSLFRRSKQLEEQLNKDLYNFTDNEIQILLFSINTAQRNTLVTYLNQARRYCDYAIKTGKKSSNINLYNTFMYSQLDNYLAKHKLKYFSKDNFDIFLKNVANECDYALYLALFEGLNGNTYSEISNLKIQDVKKAKNKPKPNNTYEIELRSINSDQSISTRTLDVSATLIKALERAYMQEDYYLKNGESTSRTSHRVILDGDYVFRNVATTKYDDAKVDKQYVYRKMNLLKEITDGEISSVLTMMNSGIIYYLSEMADQNNQVSIEDMKYVVDRYQLSVHAYSPMYTYKALAKKHKDALLLNYNVTFKEL